MMLWTAFILGLVGSAHCAGMCGPLALALPPTGRSRAAFLTGRVAYNLGRVVTYASLGALFGLLGRTLALAGFQRWVSLLAGAVILISVLLSPRPASGVLLVRVVNWLKASFGNLLRRRALSSLFGVGVLNGLLPCGLVYAACAGATASGGVVTGLGYMILFGLGTLPMMLAFSLAGQKLHLLFRFKLQRLIPVSLVLVGTLLLLRGMALGIPYVSPRLAAQPDATACCHP
jgi:sulfite exporter TauE/SafE